MVEPGQKKFEEGSEQPQVVPNRTEERIHLVSDLAFEPVSSQFSIIFHVADVRFDGITPLERFFQTF